LLDGSREAYVNQEFEIDEENSVPIKTSLLLGTDLQYSDHDFDHLIL